MAKESPKPPKDTVDAANLPDSPDKQAPAVYAVTDLREYVKPPLDDAIVSPVETQEKVAVSPCSCNTVCACVPLGACGCDQFCACDTVAPPQAVNEKLGTYDLRKVCYCEGDASCGCQADTCPCQCTCQSVYYYPKCFQPVEDERWEVRS